MTTAVTVIVSGQNQAVVSLVGVVVVIVNDVVVVVVIGIATTDLSKYDFNESSNIRLKKKLG